MTTPAPPPEPTSDPDQAWKTLSLVNDWVKHAEAKIAATLAAAGVAAGVLFNLVKDQQERSLSLNITAAASGFLLVTTAVLAALALRPRLRLKFWRQEPATSPLYFTHIARKYPVDAGDRYADVLKELTVDPDQLTKEIARQVHANATVAHRKYRLVHGAIGTLLLGLLLLAAVALVITEGW